MSQFWKPLLYPIFLSWENVLLSNLSLHSVAFAQRPVSNPKLKNISLVTQSFILMQT